jgi:hypothetical protein
VKNFVVVCSLFSGFLSKFNSGKFSFLGVGMFACSKFWGKFI